MNRIFRNLLIPTVAALFSSCASIDIASGTHLTPTEKMMWSTYALATPQGMATCVLVNRRDPSAPSGVRPILITSAHVLTSAPHGPFYLIVREQAPGEEPIIGVVQFTCDPTVPAPFFVHPTKDVAVMELDVPQEFAGDVPLPSFIDESAIGRANDQIHVGDDLLVLGFPHVLPGTEGAFGVLRSGKMASYCVGAAPGTKNYLINTTVFGGDSGAPVFTADRYHGPKLVGILTQRIGEKEAGIPLAVAINASIIREALDLQSLYGRVRVGQEEAVGMARPAKQPQVRLAGRPVPWSQSAIASLKPKASAAQPASFTLPPMH